MTQTLQERIDHNIRLLVIEVTAKTGVTGKVPDDIYDIEEKLANAILSIIQEEKIKEAEQGFELTSYSISTLDTSYKKGWRTGANRVGAEAKRHKEKRITELQKGVEG